MKRHRTRHAVVSVAAAATSSILSHAFSRSTGVAMPTGLVRIPVFGILLLGSWVAA